MSAPRNWWAIVGVAIVPLILFSANWANSQTPSPPWVDPGSMPTPADTIPPTDNATGAAGSTPTYVRGDAIRPARYRSGSCTIAGGQGQCTITWSTPFATTPNPLGDPAVLNPNFATAQLTCNWVTMSTTQGTIVCRSSVLSLAILGNILTALGNGATVYGTAVQPL